MAVFLRVAPWLLFGLGQLALGPAWAASLAAAGAVVIAVVGLARGARPSELILDAASAVYFLVFAALVLGGATALLPWVAAGAQLWLGAVVGGFLLGGLPFTLPLARREVPAEVGTSEGFRRFNVLLTAVWLGAFLVSGLALCALVAAGVTSAGVQVPIVVVALVAPVLVQRRLIAAAQARGGAPDDGSAGAPA